MGPLDPLLRGIPPGHSALVDKSSSSVFRTVKCPKAIVRLQRFSRGYIYSHCGWTDYKGKNRWDGSIGSYRCLALMLPDNIGLS